MKRQRRRALLHLLAATGMTLTMGCANAARSRAAPPVRVDPWPEQRLAGGKIVLTEHYAIHTTILAPKYQRALANLMEEAFAQYQSLAPAPRLKSERMTCYVFRKRSEWEAFTTEHAYRDAPTYLRINRGGYTIGDRFVIFSAGHTATLAAAAHEGWHQYAARNFADRIPPFLEEGLACFFENVRMGDDGRPIWNLEDNHNRTRALRMASEKGNLFPLDELITLHAGEVVAMSGARVEAFYAQNWAFARFLWQADGGRYRPLLRQLLAGAVAGTLSDSGSHQSSGREAWDSREARLVLARYLGEDFDELDRAYQRFANQLIQRDARHRRRDD